MAYSVPVTADEWRIIESVMSRDGEAEEAVIEIAFRKDGFVKFSLFILY